jgi:hypothetical protein
MAKRVSVASARFIPPMLLQLVPKLPKGDRWQLK